MFSLILRITALLTAVCWCTQGTAAINLLLTQGANNALPIAIVPFSGQESSNTDSNLTTIVTSDLSNSGRFQPLSEQKMLEFPHNQAEVDGTKWQKANVEALVVGNVKPTTTGQYKVDFSLLEINKGDQNTHSKLLLQKEFVVAAADLRRLAHHISDLVYEKLLGERGIFSTRIAYVVKQSDTGRMKYSLQVADADGFNPRALLISHEPIMSPAWSPDGKRLAYVSFEKKRSQIYVADIASGSRKVISEADGINGAPSWSPDGNQLAVVLSKGANTKIFSLNLATGEKRQLTEGNSIDTEPVWSPDGSSIYFTSDRGGSPQIYRLMLSSGSTQRITFKGDYNASPEVTSDGQHLVILNRQDGMYNIAIQDLRSGRLTILTNSGRDESPSVAPNGSMIIYGSEYGVLGLVSADGRVKLRLPAPEGKIQEPTWSPFL